MPVIAESELDLLTRIADVLAGPGGTFFLIVIIAAGLITRKLVLGWMYDECVQNGTACRKDLSDRVAKSEAELDQFRREREGRHG